MKTILDLCGGSGAWSRPYADAGYDVRIIDPCRDGGDVRVFQFLDEPVHGVLAAPPCTIFASSGARWHRTEGELQEALAIVDACLRIVVVHRPEWWALENPVGTLRRYLGPPRWKFNPSDYGDPYTKKTLLWGDFNIPFVQPVVATEGSRLHRLSPTPDRAALRSVTPAGFAQAFFDANP
jgi:hypothetical protein